MLAPLQASVPVRRGEKKNVRKSSRGARPILNPGVKPSCRKLPAIGQLSGIATRKYTRIQPLKVVRSQQFPANSDGRIHGFPRRRCLFPFLSPTPKQTNYNLLLFFFFFILLFFF